MCVEPFLVLGQKNVQGVRVEVTEYSILSQTLPNQASQSALPLGSSVLPM
jgi:hypothetical protein